jgi:hypothetical protein
VVTVRRGYCNLRNPSEWYLVEESSILSDTLQATTQQSNDPNNQPANHPALFVKEKCNCCNIRMEYLTIII